MNATHGLTPVDVDNLPDHGEFPGIVPLLRPLGQGACCGWAWSKECLAV